MVDKYWAVKEAITPFRNRFNKRKRYSRKFYLVIIARMD